MSGSDFTTWMKDVQAGTEEALDRFLPPALQDFACKTGHFAL